MGLEKKDPIVDLFFLSLEREDRGGSSGQSRVSICVIVGILGDSILDGWMEEERCF
jgi:hypothetical protein